MRTWLRMPVLAAAAAALLIPSLAASAPSAQASVSGSAAPAGHRAAPPARRAPSAPARPGTGKRASAVAAALKQARSAGQPVSVGSGSSVNPDGTFTVTAPAASKNGVYQVKVPSQLSGAVVKSAAVTAGTACSGPTKLTLSVTGAGGQSLGGGTWKSSGTAACSSSGVSLPVTGAVKRAAGQGWKTFTFRLSGARVSSPKLQVTYAQPPAVPSGPAVSAGSLKDAPCGGSSAPAISPGQAATMRAGAYDSAGAPVTERFTYWVKGSPKKTTVTSAPALSGQAAKATIPASFTRGLGKNAVVDWTAVAVSPASDSGTTSASAVCGMAVDATAEQGAPVISGAPASDPVPGTTLTYTVTAADASQSGVTPTAVVWDLDNPPPVSDPSPDQTVSVASGDTSAQVKADVPSPGPHALFAYVQYSDGSISATATSQFTADSDSPVYCPSFAAALTNTLCTTGSLTGPIATTTHASQMISNGDNDTSGTADAEGGGRALPASDLQAAGWNPGGTVTVDGATFTLPRFGSSDSGNDNLLAAGQQIGLAGQGSSLVFLVAGTDQDTTAPAASQTPGPMSPVPPAGTPVVGQDCDRYQAGLSGTNCVPAPSGTITYGDSLTNPAGSQDYSLEAPDWQKMTPSISAVSLPDYSDSSGLVAQGTQLYAVSVPIDPAKPVAGVTLPDVGAMVADSAGSSWPAMHILGLAISNTSTATPGNLSATIANTAGPWTGSWASPPEAPMAPKTGSAYGNQTIRVVTQLSTSGSPVKDLAGNDSIAVRLRLSDALADTGTAPLSIGAVTVAPQSSGAAVNTAPLPDTVPEPVTFNTSQSVTIPAGTDVYSDPVLLPQGVLNAGTHLTVSIDLTGSYPSLPTATYCSACTEYVSASGSGDQTANTDGTPFSGTGTATGDFSSILTGVDVLDVGSTATTPKPAVAVLGNGVTDGSVSGTTAVHGANRVSDDLASSLALQPGGPGYGVVNAGIEANRLLTDADTGKGTYGGPAALSRLARDVLAEPGIGTVVIDPGDEDLIKGTSEQDLYTNGLVELSRELTAWGITTIWTTQPACHGYAACTADVDNARQTVNTDLLAQGLKPGTSCSSVAIPPCQYTADFATAVGQYDATGFPDELTAAADAGDHVNLSNAGYAAETRTIPVTPGQTPLAANSSWPLSS